MKNISETEVLQILGKNNLNNYQVSGEKKDLTGNLIHSSWTCL